MVVFYIKKKVDNFKKSSLPSGLFLPYYQERTMRGNDKECTFLPDFGVNCACRNNWCNGADITEDGMVDIFDLAKIASNWIGRGRRLRLE